MKPRYSFRNLCTLAATLGLISAPAITSAAEAPVVLQPVFQNIKVERPITVAVPADGTKRLFLVQQRGLVRILPQDESGSEAKTFLDLSSRKMEASEQSKFEEGLVGFAFHPKFAENGKFYGSVALRAALLPFLSMEGGIAYRQDSFANDDLKVRQWPVTASLWLTPAPILYAGGGLGWYRTTYDYRSTLAFKDVTTDKVGVHLGGGLSLPVSPHLGLDLNGRYIFMQKDNSVKFPTQFNPDFWSTTLGLAFKF